MNIFRKKTVDGVLSVFNKTIADLEGIAATAHEAHTKATEDANKLLKEASEHSKEAVRAKDVALKIKTLISVEGVKV